MPLFKRAQPDAVLACPVDGEPMEKLHVDDVTVDRCGECHGTWFDDRELRRVAHDKEIETLATRVGRVALASVFHCPRCEAGCVQAYVADVQVDTCTSCHGVWLDRGELEEAKRQIQVNRVLAEHGPGFREFLTRL